jgi:carbonic anhydrase/acetyltransferase-like protein (isoleucine patch superfamily)
MAIIRTILGKTPAFGKNCWMAETAVITGDMICGDDCTFWYNAVVRGDVHYIRLGNKVNVQDNATIHCTYQKAPTTIGNSVSIGHNAIVHGCTIHDNVLIGMGAIVMDHAVVESGSIIAAGAVVLENTHVESGYIYAGTPAKKVKQVDPEHVKDLIERIANNYLQYAEWYKDGETKI